MKSRRNWWVWIWNIEMMGCGINTSHILFIDLFIYFIPLYRRSTCTKTEEEEGEEGDEWSRWYGRYVTHKHAFVCHTFNRFLEGKKNNISDWNSKTGEKNKLFLFQKGIHKHKMYAWLHLRSERESLPCYLKSCFLTRDSKHTMLQAQFVDIWSGGWQFESHVKLHSKYYLGFHSKKTLSFLI